MVNRGEEKVKVHMNVVPRSSKNTNRAECSDISGILTAPPAVNLKVD